MKLLKYISVLTFTFLLLFLVSFKSHNTNKIINLVKQNKDLKVAYFASGCFWCVEAVFESVAGVEEAVSGYSGGKTKNPTYREIGRGKTGHAEVVAVYYDPKIISFETLVAVFFGSHDPTTKNGQHPDYGSQYRSIAFYKNREEKEVIEKAIVYLNKKFYKGKIATEVTKFVKFYEAEEYHQNYERLHPENPYIQQVSIPRLNRFKKAFSSLLKKEEKH